MMADSLSEATRAAEPWLHAVAVVMQRICRQHPRALACPEPRYREIATDVARLLNSTPGQLLQSAKMANFLTDSAGQVKPAIRLLGRLGGCLSGGGELMLSPERMAEMLIQRVGESPEPLQVLWCRVDDESRTRCAEQLRAHRGSLALVPVVVRSQIFIDPNSILSDLNQILSAGKSEILGLDLRQRQPIVIVLLSRAEFRLAQTGSSIRLPDWFPHLGGTEIYVRVRDLLFDVEVSRFNAPEARADDLAAHLHSTEGALVRRMEVTL